MKKNTMMRIASVLLVAALISACAISGTFAKYVTKTSGTDTARVAKWGIVMELTAPDVFAKEYETSAEHKDGETAYAGLAVKAEEKVVAPGTDSSEVGDTITANISGKPEVATHLELSIKDIKDVFLPAGTYTDYTELAKGTDNTYGYTGTFTVGEGGYAPIVWDLTIGSVSVKAKSLTEVLARADEIAGKLTGLGTVTVDAGEDYIILSMDVEPGTDLDFDFKLAWAWVFEQDMDKADTLLGNLAAGAAPEIEGASLEVSATVEVLAVQID
ncbi:MAG: hypothetical protein J6Z15_02625 [Oscillospiraceae bacterium]|nr:hypothetical protein [Oscillospiraceae bacterium]